MRWLHSLAKLWRWLYSRALSPRRTRCRLPYPGRDGDAMTVHLVHAPDGARHGFVPKKIVNFRLAQDAATLRHAGVETAIWNGQLRGQQIDDAAFEAMTSKDLLVLPLLDGTACAPAIDWALRAKAETGIRVVACGELATFATQEILDMYPGIDVLIRGEEDIELCTLAQAETLPRIVDAAPVDASHWVLPEESVWGRYATFQSSRGCAYRCTFCSVNAFADPHSARAAWRGIEAGRLAEWFEILAAQGVSCIELADADVLGTTKRGLARAAQLTSCGAAPLNLMAPTRADTVVSYPALIERMVGYGFTRWQIGVESADEATLRRFRKNLLPATSLRAVDDLRRLGAQMRLEFIMFEPDSTLDTLKANLMLLGELRDRGISIQRALFNRLRVGRWSPNTLRGLKADNRLRRNIFPLFDYVDRDVKVARVFDACRLAHTTNLVRAEMLGLLLERLTDVNVSRRSEIEKLQCRLDRALWKLCDDVVRSEGREDVAVPPAEVETWLCDAANMLRTWDLDACFPGTHAWVGQVLGRSLDTVPDMLTGV